LLDGATYANAWLPWDAPGPVVLPADADERRRLVLAHLEGAPASVIFCPVGKPPRLVAVEALILFALTGAAGRCRWLAFDLDGASHGPRGLVNPEATGRAIAERLDALGLAGGLVAARSRSGTGVHLFVLLVDALPIAEAALVAAYVAACARRVADRDADDTGRPHAFRTAAGVASPGDAGAVELLPRSDAAPPRGYPLLMPLAGALAPRGGGVLVDLLGLGLSDPTPGASLDAFRRVLAEARRARATRAARRTPRNTPREWRPRGPRQPRAETAEFLGGRTPVGARNDTLFRAACDLFRCGGSARDVEADLLRAAEANGLPSAAARSTIRSALRACGGGR